MLLLSITVNAQDVQYKTEIVDVPGKSADEIYLKAKEWFVLTFNSANEVIQMDERPEVIIAKGSVPVDFRSTYKNKMVTAPLSVHFTLSSKFKDGRYKYELTISSVGSGVSGYPDQPFTNFIQASTVEGAKVVAERLNTFGVKFTEQMFEDMARDSKLNCESTYEKMDAIIASLNNAIMSEGTGDDW